MNVSKKKKKNVCCCTVYFNSQLRAMSYFSVANLFRLAFAGD